MDKKVLVIMPVYNQEDYVEAAIESVIQQTHTNLELVIINDCSTDNSMQVVNKYEYNPKVTIIENKENMGCYYTRNMGLYTFKDKDWDIFTIHDPDDISDTRRVEMILKDFDNESLIGETTTYMSVLQDGRTPVPTKTGRPDYYQSEGIAFYRREAFKLIGYFDNTRYSGDTDYVKRLEYFTNQNSQYKFGRNASVLYLRRMHGGNLTTIHPVEGRGEYYKKISSDFKRMYEAGNFYREFTPKIYK